MKRYKIKAAIDAGYQRTFLDVEISPDGEGCGMEMLREWSKACRCFVIRLSVIVSKRQRTARS